ncbi:MAG: Valine--tRNA ligase [Mycoplasmataceae bacterium]|nr:MAG: Valine--tRNA ligase [Mycoplasmataceae bacterium]
MNESRKYDFNLTENRKIKDYWSNKAEKIKNYSSTVLMPPPNITGNLHLGHSLDLVIQDFIVRSSSLSGQKVNWISGFDHAGIATQSKIENLNLSFNNNDEKKKFALEKWYPQQKNKFKEQWENLGLFLNYKQDNFTMNLDVQEKIRDYFVELYNDGLIYQSTRMINWDPKLETVISDIEIDNENFKNKLFYVEYSLFDSDDKIVVATSRPETIFADVALLVNPNDNRYQKFLGSFVINPLTNEKLPIFSSDKVIIDFGTGVLKCTPGHDFKDYEIAKNLNLPIVICYDKQGIFNNLANQWQGKNYRDSKSSIIDFLKSKNLITREEFYQTTIPRSQRSGDIIEPFVSLQWFLDLPLMVKKIELFNPNFLNEIDFFPFSISDNLFNWKNNVKEWCISRQLWWGHQIPIWYHDVNKTIFAGEKSPDDFGWKRENDVLDTWFSSSLWPLITNSENNNFSPITYLVTGSDLLFFWLFKMISFSFYFHKKPPFKKVFIHGLIRDENGKKMSKSLGNGIEPEEIISKYGVDSLRLFLLSNNVFGSDLIFEENKLKGCYFFLQKLWSIFNFILKYSDTSDFKLIELNYLKELIDKEQDLTIKILSCWVINELFIIEKLYLKNVNYKMDTSFLAKKLLEFTKEKISNSYIYLLKGSINRTSLLTLIYVFQNLLLLLNPFIPFVTEHIYKKITSKNIGELEFINESFGESIKISLIDLILIVRNKISSFCKENKIDSSTIEFQFDLLDDLKIHSDLIKLLMKKMNFIEKINVNLDDLKILNPDFIDVSPFGILKFSKLKIDKFIVNKSKSLDFYENEIKRSLGLLNNEGFLNKSPKPLIALEREKLINYQKQKERILAEAKSLEK